MSLTEQIASNDAELKELRLTESPEAYSNNMEELIEALSKNTTVDYIRLDRDFLPCMDDEHLPAFFTAIGKLPALTEAHIWHASLPVKVLADFIKEAGKLEYLELGCLEIEGSEEDFKIVSAAIKGHPTLTAFTMSDFSLRDETVVIDGFVETLATIPNLRQVKLEVTHRRRGSIVGSEAAKRTVSVTLNGGALATLIACPSLSDLTLNRLNLKLDDYEALAEAIKTSPNLKNLALPHCNLNDDGADHLARSIGANCTLEKLDFSCNNLTDEGCITIATALKENKSVKMLRLWGNVKISNAGFDALVDMLQSNLTLERVPLMAPMEYKNKIDERLMENRSAANQAA
jgi:Ran GTPase-activating protein (RanGAP) involved in mRNA processing and transport